jgi:hypothetical protein
MSKLNGLDESVLTEHALNQMIIFLLGEVIADKLVIGLTWQTPNLTPPCFQ